MHNQFVRCIWLDNPRFSSSNVLVRHLEVEDGGVLRRNSQVHRIPRRPSFILSPLDLVAYFSATGTTRGIAGEVRKQSGGDLFEIEPVREYSSDYNTVLNEAQRDQRENARPKLKGRVENFGQYDVILLGYPNWWASVPAPVASFLESYDFSGRTIIPFCSHGGGRLGQSVTAIGKLAPNAVIGTPLSVHYGGGSSLPADVAAWLAKNELNEEDGGKKR